ncbi:general stress protein 26 [Deinococcus metalli]|uniref:General stress protein 26 n=1 Tax=Deinococcus metalli TaxID=1141878 RepID=A0A7W8NSE7_9DEIO|nr:pyridoxamine 5'-phosphate oxidase family protein [Deinococcus metalli]MBB5378875.1 general stress protein 26 [Deinococcus metalli]GHF62355.1 pyridoxamine 5'-phosphate oxidase [Deinococcus metalli]
MADKTLAQLAKKMRGLDLCMLTTVTSYGRLASRPMSNNGEVEYDGTSYFYTWADSRAARDIEKNKHVQLNFRAEKSFLFVAVQGEATLTDDRSAMQEHWHKELEQWFKDGLDTPGLTMIEVKAKRVNWWGEDDGEIEL